MTDKTDTPTCWLCKTRPAESKAGTRGYSTSLCDECHAKLNGQVGVDPFETSRPLSAIEYEQRGRIAELEKELTACRAELKATSLMADASAEVNADLSVKLAEAKRELDAAIMNRDAAEDERDEAEAELAAVTRERDYMADGLTQFQETVGRLQEYNREYHAKLAASEAARDQAIKALAEEGRKRGEAEAARATAERTVQRLREVLVRIRNMVVMDPRNIQWLDAALAAGSGK